MATITAGAAQATSQPRAIHAGTNSVRGVHSWSTLPSSGDVVQMVKIPDNAVIDDLTVVLASAQAAQVGIQLGDGGDADRFLASTNYSLTAATTIVRANLALGYQYDFSDQAAVQYDTIDVTFAFVSGGATAGSVMLIAQYHMDEEAAS